MKEDYHKGEGDTYPKGSGEEGAAFSLYEYFVFQAIGAMEVLFASSRTERKNKNIEDNEFFGDVIILPITLSMKEQRSDDSREEEKQMDIDREKS